MAILAGCPMALAKRAVCSCSGVYSLFSMLFYLSVVRKITNIILYDQTVRHFFVAGGRGICVPPRRIKIVGTTSLVIVFP